ncbi:hypothetical protein VTI74DRAFT_7005 [Chaetomium olivicolor]
MRDRQISNRLGMMDPTQRPVARAHHHLDAFHTPLLPPLPRPQDEPSPPYTTPNSNDSPGDQYNIFPARRQGTPMGYLVGSNQLWEPRSRATPPLLSPMRRADGSSSHRPGSGSKPAPSASPMVGKSKRVRTGCLTCRERHLKCDEGHPDCNNCRKSSRECRRGVRLNFIDTKTKGPPYLVPRTTEWSVQFLDESRSIASEYKGGLGRYPKTPPLPRQADLNVPLHHAEAYETHADLGAHFRSDVHGNFWGAPERHRPTNDVGEPPPRVPRESWLSLGRRESPPLANPPAFFSAHDHRTSHGTNPHPRGDRSHNESTTTSIPIIHAPKSQDLRHGGHIRSGRHLSPPTGLMTPLSEETHDRAYLTTDQEIHLMQVFVEEVATWIDALDTGKHFAYTIPSLALKLPMLLNALLACGAKHLTMIGAEEGEKAEYYYDLATTQLLRAQQERDCDLTACTLTAVALNAYQVMNETSAQTLAHIASTRALIQKRCWDASSTGLGAACFWANISMEVLTCLSLNRLTSWEPDEWGMDLEFTTLEATSRSSRRSMMELEDVLEGDDDHQPPMPDTAPESGDEELWLQRIFYILAKVVNFRARDPRLQETSRLEGHSQDRPAEWRRLQNMCIAWNRHCPHSMQPYGYSPGPSAKSLFPNVWLIKPPSTLARLFYHTSMCLLAQTNPVDPHGNAQNWDSQLLHAHHTCGIVAHSSCRGDNKGVLRYVAFRCLGVVGEGLVDKREREEVARMLEGLGRGRRRKIAS